MTRSNRTLTQFAVDKIYQAMLYGPETVATEAAGNTQVEISFPSSPNDPPCLIVNLFGKEIIRLYFSPANKRSVCGVMLSAGDFYDSMGRPSRTTRERINGALDALGSAGFLPEGVRVFIRPQTEQCCVGIGDSCRALDKESPKVFLLSHPRDLVFS